MAKVIVKSLNIGRLSNGLGQTAEFLEARVIPATRRAEAATQPKVLPTSQPKHASPAESLAA